ncbi:dual specificity protein phosphatase 3-like [Saccoglossus kowalevskii]|uniref:Dual specificity protein phosphatase n=1 Tax=Saccoglossus kowalevskii TaxID=10224 RepID=A0ABM0GRN1_SACKO|nr:PREDICTED: dual specificity protein phosphatase 3-like [Saccoglossus kowalevskii]
MARSGDTSDTASLLSELGSILTAPANGMLMAPSRAYDEVWPGLYVGERSTAMNKAGLKHIGITHILNTAEGKGFGHVSTNEAYYKETGIVYKGIKASDVLGFNLKPFWQETGVFIHDALKENGKVMVHCVEGFSRSASTAIAYLMMYQDMTVQEATRTVRAKREIGPNSTFRKQLCELNREITLSRKDNVVTPSIEVNDATEL